MSPDVCLVSGTTQPRLLSPVNHKVYATLAGMDYRLEQGPIADLQTKFHFKLETIVHVLPRYDWVVWMDDDAYVTDFDARTFTEQIDKLEAGGKYFAMADGFVTAANAGVMLLKNNADGRAFFDAAMRASIDEVERWWDPARLGKFCHGDQDALVWAMQAQGFEQGCEIVSHDLFNSRSYEYGDSAGDRFVCHFPGVLDKNVAVAEFARRFGLDDTLVPAALRARFGLPWRQLSRTKARYLTLRVEVGRRVKRHGPP